MRLALLFSFTGMLSLATAQPLDRENPFGYPDAAADAALAHAEGDAGRLEELLAFPAALAIPRLDQYLRKRSHPEHTKKARELIPQVPGWLEYYQWSLAEAYKTANPRGNLSKYAGGPPVAEGWVEAFQNRIKIGAVFGSLSMLDRPEAVALLASYLDDRGEMLLDEDMGVDSVQGLAAHSLNSYFQRTTGKFTTTIPDKWQDWWVANQGLYPRLPEKPPKPWFPPPATPAPATPRPVTPDPIVEMIRRASAAAEARRRAQPASPLPAPAPTTPEPPPTALIPHIRTEEEAAPWLWITAIVCTLLAGAAAFFLFRRRT